jgi:hypothetical protein
VSEVSKLGTQPELERAYREKLLGAHGSVRQQILEAYRDGSCSDEEWKRILATRESLDEISRCLSLAGYTGADIVALSEP